MKENRDQYVEKRKEILIKKRNGNEERVFYEISNGEKIFGLEIRDFVSIILALGAILSPFITLYIARNNLIFAESELLATRMHNKNTIDQINKNNSERFSHENDLSVKVKEIEMRKDSKEKLQNQLVSINKSIEIMLLLDPTYSAFSKKYIDLKYELFPSILAHYIDKNRLNEFKNVLDIFEVYKDLITLQTSINISRNLISEIIKISGLDNVGSKRAGYYYGFYTGGGFDKKFVGFDIDISEEEWDFLLNKYKINFKLIADIIFDIEQKRHDKKLIELGEKYLTSLKLFSNRMFFLKYNKKNPLRTDRAPYANIPMLTDKTVEFVNRHYFKETLDLNVEIDSLRMLFGVNNLLDSSSTSLPIRIEKLRLESVQKIRSVQSLILNEIIENSKLEIEIVSDK